MIIFIFLYSFVEHFPVVRTREYFPVFALFAPKKTFQLYAHQADQSAIATSGATKVREVLWREYPEGVLWCEQVYVHINF